MENLMYEVRLERVFSQNREQLPGIEYIIERATGGNRGRWTASQVTPHATETDHRGRVYSYTLVFEKTSGRRNNEDLIRREWHRLLQIIRQTGENTRFGQYPWNIVHATHNEGSAVVTDGVAVDGVQVDSQGTGTRSAAGVDFATLEDVREACMAQINALLEDDDLLTSTFNEIYDRNAQIRTLLSSIKSFFESDGRRRNHALLWGLPACAKTQILSAVTDMLGDQAVLSLDATSTTSAGIYKMFFEQLDVIPPIVKIEEMEKCEESALRVWLGALDERGELRKVNYREQRVREVRILCLGTCNDKDQFDRLMGGTEKKPGALSSRFVHQLKCPRPNREVLFKILCRDVHKFGGDTAWIMPSILLAEALETDDPRKVLAFLDGGVRLMNGAYQQDILKIVEMEDKYDGLMERTMEAVDAAADTKRSQAERLRRAVA